MSGYIQDSGKGPLRPHHSVKKNSAATSIRVVCDYSCQQSERDPLLNDLLLQEPDFLNDLCSILLPFQTHPFTISTDIEKAFLHIYMHLHEKDRDFTRFFWLTDPSNPKSELAVYCFKTTLRSCQFSLHFVCYTVSSFTTPHTPLSRDIQTNLY